MSVRVIWRLVAMNVMLTLEYRGAFVIIMVNTDRRNEEIVQCDSCQRILYFVPAPAATQATT